MTDDAFVDGLSARAIEERTLAWREAFGVGDQWVPDMLTIMEHQLPSFLPDFAFVVRDDERMADAEAYTQFRPPRIVVRESVYQLASEHEGRARMTLAHELGHFVLHKGLGKARGPLSEGSRISKPFNSAEWQARKFAAYFLLPEQVVRQFSSAAELSEGCRVSLQAASIRFTEIIRPAAKQLPDCVAERIHGARD
jgi:Zn-dependent peptidase ImmA (M78 family)